MKPPEIFFDLHFWKKSETNPHILKDDFRKMQSRYKNYQQIYQPTKSANIKPQNIEKTFYTKYSSLVYETT